MGGGAAYEDHMCHKMDEGRAEKSAQMWSVSPLIVIMTHNRNAEERAPESASVIIICNHVTLRHSNPLPHSSRLFKHKLVIVRAIQIRVALLTSGTQIIRGQFNDKIHDNIENIKQVPLPKPSVFS